MVAVSCLRNIAGNKYEGRSSVDVEALEYGKGSSDAYGLKKQLLTLTLLDMIRRSKQTDAYRECCIAPSGQ